MITYWLAFIFSTLIFLILYRLRLQKKIQSLDSNICTFYLSFPLFFVAGFRYGVGTDFFSYLTEFRKISSGENSRFEPFYLMINKIVSSLDLPAQFIFLITSFIFCFFVVKAILEESPDPILSLFLLIGTMNYFISFNAVRQMTGCSIVLYGIKYIKERKFKSFLLIIILAACFHISCIFCIFVYPLCNALNIDRKKSLIIILGLSLFSQAIISLIYYILTKLDLFVNLLYRDNYNYSVGTWVYVNICIFLFAFFVCEIKIKDNQIYYASQLIFVCLYFFIYNIPFIHRVMYLFSLPSIILIPKSIKCIKKQNIRMLIKFGTYFLFFIYSSYSVVISGSHDVAQYHFFGIYPGSV